MRLKLSEWIATCLKVGYLPLAPGTWGSAFAILIWFIFLKNLSPIIFGLLIILFIFIGIITANTIIDNGGGNDPSYIIIDELVGQWLALWMLPNGSINIIIVFILFRFFDIFKPWPVRFMEKFPRGFGIMFDDIAAGILTFILIQAMNIYIF